jgi:hypothetical protein
MLSLLLSISSEESGTVTKYEAGNKFNWVLMFSFVDLVLFKKKSRSIYRRAL